MAAFIGIASLILAYPDDSELIYREDDIPLKDEITSHTKGLFSSIREYFQRIGRNVGKTAALGTLYAFLV